MNRLVRSNQKRATEFLLTPDLLARVAQQKAAKEAKAAEKEAKIRAQEEAFRNKQVQRKAKEDERRRKSTETADKKAAKQREKERLDSLRKEPVRNISKELTNNDIREMAAQVIVTKETAVGGMKKSKPVQGNDLNYVYIKLLIFNNNN